MGTGRKATSWGLAIVALSGTIWFILGTWGYTHEYKHVRFAVGNLIVPEVVCLFFIVLFNSGLRACCNFLFVFSCEIRLGRGSGACRLLPVGSLDGCRSVNVPVCLRCASLCPICFRFTISFVLHPLL